MLKYNWWQFCGFLIGGLIVVSFITIILALIITQLWIILPFYLLIKRSKNKAKINKPSFVNANMKTFNKIMNN